MLISPSRGSGPDRRRDPRIDVRDGRVRVTEVGAQYDVRVLDVSAGGFLASTPVPYPIDTIRSFVFVGRYQGVPLPLQAKAVFSHWEPGRADIWPEYQTGFQFLNVENRLTAGRIDQLMAAATSPLEVLPMNGDDPLPPPPVNSTAPAQRNASEMDGWVGGLLTARESKNSRKI